MEEKWKIEFYGVAGCIVDQELVDSVKRENAKVLPLIKAKYGRNWQKKFYAYVEAEYEIEAIIDTLVRK
jgi:hypothetical protein